MPSASSIDVSQRMWSAPHLVVPLVNLAASLAYNGRDLASGNLGLLTGLGVVASLALSAVGSGAVVYLVIGLTPRRRTVAIAVALLVATLLASLHIIQFCYYRESGGLVSASVVDFARQHPVYAWSMILDQLTPLLTLAWLAVATLVAAWLYRWIMAERRPLNERRCVWAATFAIAPLFIAPASCLLIDQQGLRACCTSLAGFGAVNVQFTPDRVQLPVQPVERPNNLIVFRLESISRDVLTVYNPRVPTSPFWAHFAEQHPEEMFIARRHFANSTVTDVAVPLLYTGAGAADSLDVHRKSPLLWSYAKSGGYNASAFFPYPITWGDFGQRFQERPGVTALDRMFHATVSGKPWVYEMCVNDDDVVDAAIEYQQGRAWQGPFVQVVELNMPHAYGAGARANGINRFPPGSLPPDLATLGDYLSSIRFDDEQIRRFIEAMPEAVREQTVMAVVSDHGEDLYRRLARRDNYFQETLIVPFWLVIPQAVQQRLPPEGLVQLKRNLAETATSNQDLLPTLLDLLGVSDRDDVRRLMTRMPGRSLLRDGSAPEFIVALNTGELRTWEREGFAIVLDNGTKHYIFSTGTEFFFDLTNDPLEHRNLIDDPAIRDGLARVRKKILATPHLLRIAVRYGLRFSP